MIVVNFIGAFWINLRWLLQMVLYDPKKYRYNQSQMIVQGIVQLMINIMMSYSALSFNKVYVEVMNNLN